MRLIQLVMSLCLAMILVDCGSGSQSQTSTLTNDPTATPPANNPMNLTPLSALTGNNTSAAGNFFSQSNGNLGANNVSKINIHSLLYAGAQTKVLAHLLLWFGQSNHMNVGYSSSDPAQVSRQITDMISRGIDGVVVDWYGPNNFIDQATQLVMHEAEKHAGFTFAIMIDGGAMANACFNCSPKTALAELLNYVEETYFPSPAYMTIAGQPLVTEFNVDPHGSINWQAVNAELKIPPRFLFQDDEGFRHEMSDGSYSWVMPQDAEYGLEYLSNFYQTGMMVANTETVGASYKGFNDALASWGSGRYMGQQCGETWLETFSAINQLYNSDRQLPYLQLVTWNDYEEATEIESGIDNCFSLEASVSSNTLEWSTNGDENTIDHYNVYSSPDGQNLSQVTETQPGVHSVDLCSLSLSPGPQLLFVQAVGKPTLANRMPAPVHYTPGCGQPKS
jgi:Glycosyl hydrolase family 71